MSVGNRFRSHWIGGFARAAVTSAFGGRQKRRRSSIVPPETISGGWNTSEGFTRQMPRGERVSAASSMW